jgi:hypothetical protein
VALPPSKQIDFERAGDPVPFSSPVGEAEREDLRWYLEDYLIAPYAVYEERGRKVEERLPLWGRSLFESIFGAGKPGHDAYLKAREGQAELVIMSRSPVFLGLPWELLHGRVEMWRGFCRSNISVSAPFVWRCLSGSTLAPFPHPAHRTGQADFPHPALGQDLTPSPTARRARAPSGVRARSARKGARVDKSRPCFA